MNAREFAEMVAAYDRAHAIDELRRAYVAAMNARRVYCDSLLVPLLDITPPVKPRYAPGAWGIAHRDWRYR